MTMKKKIFLSNTLMVLIALLILFSIGGLSVLLFKEEFMNIIEQNAQLSDDTYEIQKILYDQIEEPVDWEQLGRNLGSYDFQLYVSDADHLEQYSNVRHREWECIEELERDDFSYDRVRLYNMENVTIARCRVSVQEEPYMVYAVNYAEKTSLWGIDRGLFEMFIIVFVIAGMIIIAGLLLCSQIFTKLMIKRIMKPVDELNQAAIRINDGNFDEPVGYHEPDEFGEVCETFNRMQEHLKESIEQSKAYEKARTEMISGISHDLRTPLTSVKGFIKGMLDGIASTPHKQRQYLEISYQKACDMEVLLQKLFFVSKLETGNMPFFMQQTELGAWMETYVSEKCAQEMTPSVQLNLQKAAGEYPVMLDDSQMKRVFDNLVENSRKYAAVEEIQVTISMSIKDGYVILIFADNGTGIAEEKLAHVFEQFYRGDEARNSRTDGSGLGLYVCKYIVEEHKGQIRAFQNHGFCVEIRLPAVMETEEEDTHGEDFDC